LVGKLEAVPLVSNHLAFGGIGSFSIESGSNNFPDVIFLLIGLPHRASKRHDQRIYSQEQAFILKSRL